ncbi:hypothetical protein Cgig2_025527 [Carnegiea gigantea]|uniref:Uncharacterized protein n=1 Tax=Carnegiea gigantea TaxID=171969 RepID=A0A9Q1KAZ9_9CARY|nr:hypothetical protein Cgig2_025527 [Carnegiea gigantea]
MAMSWSAGQKSSETGSVHHGRLPQKLYDYHNRYPLIAVAFGLWPINTHALSIANALEGLTLGRSFEHGKALHKAQKGLTLSRAASTPYATHSGKSPWFEEQELTFRFREEHPKRGKSSPRRRKEYPPKQSVTRECSRSPPMRGCGAPHAEKAAPMATTPKPHNIRKYCEFHEQNGHTTVERSFTNLLTRDNRPFRKAIGKEPLTKGKINPQKGPWEKKYSTEIIATMVGGYIKGISHVM